MKAKAAAVVLGLIAVLVLASADVPLLAAEGQKQLEADVNRELTEMGMPLLTGTVWQSASRDEKVAFVWGFCHVVSIEQALVAEYPQLKVENFSAKVIEGMAGMTMNDIVDRVDTYYAANPGQLTISVARVIWDTAIKPNLKTGIAGQPLQK